MGDNLELPDGRLAGVTLLSNSNYEPHKTRTHSDVCIFCFKCFQLN